MKFVVVLIAAGMLLSGCGNVNHVVAGWTGSTETCVDGVKYLQFPSGATVKYNTNGTIATCK